MVTVGNLQQGIGVQQRGGLLEMLTDGRDVRELKDLERQRTQLQGRLDAAATVIAALHHDNAGLREELAGRGAIVALDERRASRAETIGPH
ncbi:hypothetical protein JBE04_12760 [Streptomyces sp. PRKS01-29]|nr:hypothetical protein [Streptomyces sabulosicollis]MBI0295315.1 hypothetical protein [Streptomyces sabulosicollis]